MGHQNQMRAKMKFRSNPNPRPGEIVASGSIDEVIEYHQEHGWQVVPGSGRWEPDPDRSGRERFVVEVVRVDMDESEVT